MFNLPLNKVLVESLGSNTAAETLKYMYVYLSSQVSYKNQLGVDLKYFMVSKSIPRSGNTSKM